MRDAVDGVLLLDKPSGPSSNAVLQRAKRLLGAERAGHTGTLDPLASGLLVIAFGEATKFTGGLLEADKANRAALSFGAPRGGQGLPRGAELRSAHLYRRRRGRGARAV